MFFYFIFLKYLLNSVSSISLIKIPFSKRISEDFMENLFNIDIITNVSLGNPPQQIQLSFSFHSESILIKGSLFNSQYNEKKSINSKPLNVSGNSFYYDQYYKTEFIYDDFIFEVSDNNKISKKKLERCLFQLINTTSIENKINSGVIGLKIFGIEKYNDNFIEQIYKYHVINNKIFFIEYINDNNGFIYFGELPHIYDNKTYDEKYYVKTPNEYFGRWKLNFDKIIVNEKQISLDDKISGKFDFKIKGIIGDVYFKFNLNDNFFMKYIKDNICFSESYSLDNKNNITIYKCKQNLNIKSFPKISFYQKDFNYTFEFEGKELFIKDKNNNYIFLISFYDSHSGDLILGEIFLKKYKLIIEYNYKMIGFYTKIKDKSSLNIKDYLTLIVFIIMIIIIILLIYFLIKSHRNKRKIRANELEDNYEYFPN